MFGKKAKTEEPQGAVGQIIQEEKAKLNQIMVSINSAMQERDDLQETIKENTEKTALIFSELESAESKLDNLRKERYEYAVSVSEMKTELSSLKGGIQKEKETAQIELEEMTSRVKSEREKVSNLVGESQLVSKAIFTKEGELLAVSQKIDQVIEEGRKSLLVMDTKNIEANEILTGLLSDLELSSAEKNNLNKELASLRSETSQLREDVQIQKELVKGLRASSQELEFAKKKAEDSLAKVGGELAVETEKYKDMASKIIAAAQKEKRLASRETYLRKLYKDSSIEFPLI